MNPYLEQPSIFHDLHNSLVSRIRDALAPQLVPLGYLPVIEATTYFQIGQKKRGVAPDVEIRSLLHEPAMVYETAGDPSPPRFSLSMDPVTEEREVGQITIQDRESGDIVTTIELLSPVNKRGSGYEKFSAKQQELWGRGVNLVVIDLLRAGKREIQDQRATKADYLFTVARQHVQRVDVFPFGVEEKIPVLPIPLRHPDPDVSLALKPLIDDCYERGFYELRVDYSQAY